MVDRYTRVVLTVIAACLLYLCLLLSSAGTPLSAQGHQVAGAERPGQGTPPAEVVIVGWRAPNDVPVAVSNVVTTVPGSEGAQRVVVAGWEDPKRGFVRLGPDGGLPVDSSAAPRPSRVVLAGTEVSSPAMWRQRVPVDTAKAPAEKPPADR